MLTDPCILRIASRLSPEDLCSLAQTSRFFRGAASDPAVWRALYHARWASGPSDAEQHGEARLQVSWKALYMARDAAELHAQAAAAPEAIRDIYLQMSMARRSEPLSAGAAAGLFAGPGRGSGPGVLSDRIAAFRKHRGLAQAPSAAAGPAASGASPAAAATAAAADTGTCPAGCSFVELEPSLWICEACGFVHACGPEACRERLVDPASELLVCGITGQCFQQMLSEYEEGQRGGGPGGEEAEGAAAGDWNAEEGMGGRLGRAFFAG